MEKREFGKTGVSIFPLGFGCMRLPLTDEKDSSLIDEKKAIEMIRYGIDNGINYIDTAYPYHGGESERLVAKALKDGYREKVYLATKSPVWLLKEDDDFEKLLDEQLEKLEDSCIDFYLLHALNKERLETLIRLNVFEKIDKLKKSGKIKFIGFSFHDVYQTFEDIINAYDGFDFCQIQLNYLDTDYQAGEKGLKFAHEKGLGVIIMEPVKGGRLATVPTKIKEEFTKVNSSKSNVEWAFDFLYDKKEVGIVLSGMSELNQVEENIKIAKNAEIGMLSNDERAVLGSAKDIFESIKVIPCTNCKYCLPCPHGVAIPNNFMVLNDYHIFEQFDAKKREYRAFNEKEKASNCKACGKCEPKCPQNIKIIEELKKVDKELA